MLKHRIALYLLLIVSAAVLSVTAYIGFSRWPTGAAVGVLTPATTQPISKNTLRLATFNIHSGIGDDGTFDLNRTADTLRDCDLIGLNEVRSAATSNNAGLLGEKLQLNSLFSPNERTLFHDNFGNGLLTRVPVDAWERVPMPGTQWAHHRNALVVHARLGDSPLIVIIAHVARGQDRTDQLQFLFSLFTSMQEPVVLMGDLNTDRSDPLLAPFLQSSIDAVAMQPPDDAKRIDWIFVRGLSVGAAGSVNRHASDHPMVWADVSLPRE